MNKKHNPRIQSPKIGRRSLLFGAPLIIFSILAVIGAANVRAGANVDYLLTTRTDSVKPGAVAEFVLMVTNHETSAQAVIMEFDVPPNTTYLGDTAGTHEGQRIPVPNALIPAGATQGYVFRLNVLGANQSPSDGTPITLILSDNTRGATIQRTVFVQSNPKLNLQLSTNQSSVAPGANLTYKLSYYNPSTMPASGVDLKIAVPTGASVISASDGGMLQMDGMVHWPIGMLNPSASGQRSVTFQSPAGTTGALLIDAKLSDPAGDAADVSTTILETSNAMPDLVYTLTVKSDPVRPGEVAEFVVMVTNHTSSLEPVIVEFTVPENTTYGPIGFGDDPGTPEGQRIPIPNASIPGGATQGYIFRLNIRGANLSPPNGTTITLPLVDVRHGIAISRSVVVQSAPKLNLQLSTGQASVAPGANFTYTLNYSTLASAVPNGELSVPIPAGTTLVSASNGGFSSNGVVHWPLSNINPRVNGQRTLILNASPGYFGPLTIEAALTGGTADVARASTTMLEDATAMPNITYTLTGPTAPVLPGMLAQFFFTATNHTSSPQTVGMSFTVPNYSTFDGDPAGTAEGVRIPIPNASIPAGETRGYTFGLSVPGANQSPPNGTLITLSLVDLNRGDTISRTIVTKVPKPTPDFSGDGRADIIFQHTSGARAIWLLNGTTHTSTISLGNVSPSFSIVGTGDFNGDGSPDILFQHTSGSRSIWLMNGTVHIGTVPLGFVPTAWSIAGSGDFNGDGKADILFQNTAGGRAIWLMNGTVLMQTVSLGTISASWKIVGAGDFNSDGKDDILLQNTTSGARLIWLMNGTSIQSTASLGIVSTSLNIGGTGDFNGDHKEDILFENTTTGARYIWIMNNTVHSSTVGIGVLATQWKIRNF